MSTQIDGQLDIFAELDAQEVVGEVPDPAGFTVSTGYTADQLLDAWDLQKRLDPQTTYARSHMWTPGTTHVYSRGAHRALLFEADLASCGHWSAAACQCVGSGMWSSGLSRVYCEECDWWSPITTGSLGEDAAIFAHLDHCWPGWRDLPHCGQEATSSGSGAVVPEGYPVEWQVPGAPVITARTVGTRTVPAGSPWGGYDVASGALAPEQGMRWACQCVVRPAIRGHEASAHCCYDHIPDGADAPTCHPDEWQQHLEAMEGDPQ